MFCMIPMVILISKINRTYGFGLELAIGLSGELVQMDFWNITRKILETLLFNLMIGNLGCLIKLLTLIITIMLSCIVANHSSGAHGLWNMLGFYKETLIQNSMKESEVMLRQFLEKKFLNSISMKKWEKLTIAKSKELRMNATTNQKFCSH